ncbi:protein of unknown function [Candidatus Nitrosocaldus cavascurensis]|uniref:Uncharacterized protein n=1 Tax=Candidatus Nitrosocaldus cavascurensis TaxID=2058097 RepID=A0A2K5AQL1_9ARCH|nr:protein of unknown function [Candidatus Nitrosocaldus cavascurensis]
MENRKGKISIRITDKGTRFIVLYKELRRMINAKHSSSSNTKPAL